jgi:hypothetical protein
MVSPNSEGLPVNSALAEPEAQIGRSAAALRPGQDQSQKRVRDDMQITELIIWMRKAEMMCKSLVILERGI